MKRLMNTLLLRWKHGTWVYTDEELGVVDEPFVVGADTMLTVLRGAQVGEGRDPFRITFAARPFPGALEARKISEVLGGAWYEAEIAGRKLEGWLCPHLFDYFTAAPASIYVMASPA